MSGIEAVAVDAPIRRQGHQQGAGSLQIILRISLRNDRFSRANP